MFTGLVQAVGTVAAVAPRGGGSGGAGVRIEIDPGSWDHRSSLGDSISVAGCCLTIAAAQGGRLVFDAIPETLSKTTLGKLTPGSRINLERSPAAADLLGGHFVQGHIDGVGVVEHVQQGTDYRVRVRPPADLVAFIAPQGSISIDGVSLTIAGVDVASGWFEVALIPVTLEKTTLSHLKPGDQVNLETDILAKTIVNYLRHWGTLSK